MLVSLHVKNFAIIDEIWLDFGKGFNVFSGETGAGKSLLIGSIGIALGARVSKEMLGRNADYALVELTFYSKNPEIKRIFDENDLIYDDDQIVLSRRISESGRSVCRINGETVTGNVLKEVAEVLIDIHGQHEHQSLIKKTKQREIVDEQSEEILKLLSEVRSAYRLYRDAKKLYEEALNSGRLSERELSLIRYEYDEIINAKLKEGEADALEERFKVLSNTDKILDSLRNGLSSLSENRENAEDCLDSAIRAISKVSDMDERLNSIYDELNVMSDELSDIVSRLKDYCDEVSGTEEEYAEVSERLDMYNKLKAKYGYSIEKIMAYADDLLKSIENNEKYDEYLAKLSSDLEKKESELKKLCVKLSKLRIDAASKLSTDVEKALSELNFEHAKFEIRVTGLESYTEYGLDDVEFFLSANLGEPLRSLSTAASGGELSRVMLAIKSVIAKSSAIDALIFDEIDTGISGRAAQRVSEKMALLSKTHQVLCITHLPQIAAMADSHYLIKKREEDGATKTYLQKLSDEEIPSELARMLSGAEVTDSVMANALEMKKLACALKEKL